MTRRNNRHARQNADGPTLFEAAAVPIADGVPRSAEEPRSRRAKALEEFFKARKAHSAVKTEIVTKYFPQWLRIIKSRTPSKKLGYVDLFAGPGIYGDGSESTPILIMKHILANEDLRDMVLTMFSDKKVKYVRELKKNINTLPNIGSLKHPPEIEQKSAAESHIPEYFENRAIIPTFMFLDPFGYSGLSLKLMRAVLKDWACEVMFFWNFTRINAAIRNNVVREEMDAIFGHDRVDRLRDQLKGIADQQVREAIILGTLREALGTIKAQYMEVFRFRNTAENITHHLVFVTKNILGQRIMKDIMAKASSYCDEDGVSSFEYNPNPPSTTPPRPLSLLDDDPEPPPPRTPMQNLMDDLIERYRGKSLTVEEIYEQHNYGTPYTQKNYQEALRRLFYDDQKVSLNQGFMPILPRSLRQRAMSPKYVVTFDKA